MITRSQATKDKKNVPIRSARIMKRLLAKKQQVKEEHQWRVHAKKIRRVQKKKARLCKKAKGTQSSSTAQTTSGTQTNSIIQISSSTQTSSSTYTNSSISEAQEGRNGIQKTMLNPNGEDLCDCLVRDCPGCFQQCPMCQSTKCGPLCRQNRIRVYEVITNDEGEVTRTFSLPHAK